MGFRLWGLGFRTRVFGFRACFLGGCRMKLEFLGGLDVGSRVWGGGGKRLLAF